jgi:transcriptional regulator with XRE-family HTH domain
MSLRHLTSKEQALLKLYLNCGLAMTPQDFYAKWNVTHAQIAQICGCSEPTVDRWFTRGKNHRIPDASYLRRLAEIDFLWEFYDRIPLSLRKALCAPPMKNKKEPSP